MRGGSESGRQNDLELAPALRWACLRRKPALDNAGWNYFEVIELQLEETWDISTISVSDLFNSIKTRAVSMKMAI